MVLYAAASALFNLNIFHAMRQNDIDPFVSGTVAFCGKPVKFRQRILADANCNNPVSILAAFFIINGSLFISLFLFVSLPSCPALNR